MNRDIAPVSDGDIAQTKQYQQLLADCREITEGAERHLIQQFWTLGERISREMPTDRADSYGKRIVLALERDLATDRTTLWRSIQVYHTWALPEILDNVSKLLTWRKIRMLVALDAPLRKQIEERIYSGELRTDEAVRRAIDRLLEDAGKRKALPARAARNQLSLAGFDEDVVEKPLATLWNKFDSVGRAMLVTALIPSLGLDEADRPQALELLRAMRRQVDEVEAKLGEGAE